MFKDELIEWKKINLQSFSWWNYVNMKTDLQTVRQRG